jgi:hypothetical protein
MGIGGLRVHVRTVPIMRHSSLKNSASASRQAGVFFVSSKPIVAYKIRPNRTDWLMIDALFWYTGLVAWILIVFGAVSGIVIEAHDRSVVEQMKRH